MQHRLPDGWQCEVKRFHELDVQTLYQCLQLRLEVFSLQQECLYQDLDNRDQVAHHLYVRDENQQVVAYARIFGPNDYFPERSAIGRVVNSNKVRGRGIGRYVVQHALEYCQTHWPDVACEISAQHYLLKFYQEFGFEAYGEVYLEDDIDHIRMVVSNSIAACEQSL